MKLTEFFENSNGRFSSTRLFSLLVCFTFNFVWIYSTIKYGNYNPSIEIIGVVVGVLGIKAYEDKGNDKK